MTDPTPVLSNLVKTANPFYSIAPVLNNAITLIGPYVATLSSYTTENIVGDRFLALIVTLMFMVSLILIVLSDRMSWTRSVRSTVLSSHFAILRVFRATITIGLFFVGRSISMAAASADSMPGYGAATGFLSTLTVTFVLQKMIEWFVAVGPHYVAYSDAVFEPVVDANSFLQTIFQVVYDYVKLFNELVLNALIGNHSASNLTGLLTFETVTGDKSQGSSANGRVRTLYQLYQLGVGGGAGPTTTLSGADVWYNSPLYAGVFAGLVSL
jgi:hypothetical protein